MGDVINITNKVAPRQDEELRNLARRLVGKLATLDTARLDTPLLQPLDVWSDLEDEYQIILQKIADINIRVYRLCNQKSLVFT